MKHHTSLHFKTDLSLEDLATVIELHDFVVDWENEFEWIIGVCDGVDKIDICRSHLVQPSETETTVLRYDCGMDRVIPTKVIEGIARRLMAHGITEIEVRGFDILGTVLVAPVTSELGL